MHAWETTGDPEPLGVYCLTKLDTRLQPASVERMAKNGLTLYEPFGGLCAGLEAVLRSGIRVHQYFYSDNSNPARLVAEYRCAAPLNPTT
jgi:hypothetical protein